MGLFTPQAADGYIAEPVAHKTIGMRPWGAAIRYWLPRKNMSPADLVRKTRLSKNTISRAVRGLDVNTGTLAKIAEKLEEPLEMVLISPEWMDREQSQIKVIQEAVVRALRDERTQPGHAPTAAEPDGSTAMSRLLEAATAARDELAHSRRPPQSAPQPVKKRKKPGKRRRS